MPVTGFKMSEAGLKQFPHGTGAGHGDHLGCSLIQIQAYRAHHSFSHTRTSCTLVVELALLILWSQQIMQLSRKSLCSASELNLFHLPSTPLPKVHFKNNNNNNKILKQSHTDGLSHRLVKFQMWNFQLIKIVHLVNIFSVFHLVNIFSVTLVLNLKNSGSIRCTISALANASRRWWRHFAKQLNILLKHLLQLPITMTFKTPQSVLPETKTCHIKGMATSTMKRKKNRP